MRRPEKPTRPSDQDTASAPCDSVVPAEGRLTRRAVLGVTASLVAAGCTKAEKWTTKPVKAQEGVVELDIKDYVELATAGGMVAVRPSDTRKPVLVMRIENDEFRVISLRCPHLGCTVRWDNEIQLLSCPCHGSQFDDAGRLKKGPAKTALKVLPSQRAGTRLRFKTGK